MAKTSTLIYLLDDLFNPAELCFSFRDHYSDLNDDISTWLNLLEYDPGEELVNRTLEKIK